MLGLGVFEEVGVRVLLVDAELDVELVMLGRFDGLAVVQ